MKSIINTIPKDLSKCIFTPLNYRGISLLCTISKVYSSILPVRINNYCDIRNIFVEELNGFRQSRSCIDHIFSITTIVKIIFVIINMYFVPLLILRKHLIALI